MTELGEGDYQAHQNCNVGDTVIAKDDEGNEYSGTVMRTPGATVYVMGDDGRLYEFRRITDSSTGEKAIFLGIDGKDDVSKQRERTETKDIGGVDVDVTEEHYTLSFDTVIISFDAEQEEQYIG